MCGIFGFSCKKNKRDDSKAIIENLLRFSEKRGKDASGIAVFCDRQSHVVKIPERTSLLLSFSASQRLFDMFMSCQTSYPLLIGNARLATNGSEYSFNNNQPVITKYSIGVHNGMIVNEEKIWEKFSPLRKEYDVDTEVVLKLFEYFIEKGDDASEAIRKVYKEIEGAATLAIMNVYVPSLVITTNTGSLYYIWTDDLFIFASEAYILKETLHCNYHDTIKRLLPGFGLLFNYLRFTLSSFSFQNGKNKKRRSRKEQYFSILVRKEETRHFYCLSDTQMNKLRYLEQHAPDYSAIENIRRCARCILPETMPLISFDTDGICNFCRTFKTITYKGENALKQEIERYVGEIKGKRCIVALSGGRDSSFGLHYVKNILGMNPIAYTYDWGMVTDIARRNQYRLTAALGVEHIIVSADIRKKRENIRKNVEAWLRRPNIAMVPLFMAGDKQAEYYAEQVKRQTGVNLMIYCRGNEFEDERFKFGYYGIFDGTPKGVLHNLSWRGKTQMALYYAREYIRNPWYINTSLVDTAFAYFSAYLMPHGDFIYLWHYVPWDEQTIVSTLKTCYGWETPTDTIATWRIDDGTPPFYNYIYYKVQGFTEHDGLRSNQIRQGVITRDKALRLVREENKPRYEALKWYFDVIKIDGDKALGIIDSIKTRY